MENNNTLLEIKSLTKIYSNNKVAANNVYLTINKGEIFGFIGHNGAGKTTTIKCIVGLLEYNNGEILFEGKNIKLLGNDYKKNIAYIPDNPDLYEYLTGLQYLNFICDINEISKENRISDINMYSQMFGIESNLKDLIHSYSHGMKQKLAIISALIRHPKLLILDEPFVGLDPKASYDVKEVLKKMCQEGCSVFFSTHVLEVAEKLCDKIAIIKNGEIVTCGNVDVVKGDQSLEDVFMELVDHE